jgi:tricarballylate dehydrogenase
MGKVVDDYDVVVVGAGNAGLVAALAAHDAGARVLVLEAAPYEERGGNSRFAGAIFRITHGGKEDLSPLLTDEGRAWLDRVDVGAYTAADYHTDSRDASGGYANELLVSRLIADSYDTVGWMQAKGVEWELTVGKLIDPENLAPGERYALPPGGALRAVGEGVGLVERLFAAVEDAGITVWYDSPAHAILTSGRHTYGVSVRRADSFQEVHGVVVLAAGGFEANPEMRGRYLGQGWDLVKVRGSRFNTGTMLTGAIAAGAMPAGHWAGCHASPLDADAPAVGELRITDKLSRYSYPYGLLVNIQGERFVDEGEDQVWLTYAKTGAAILRQPHARAFQIFDQKTVHLLEPRYSTGIPIVADSLDELAAKAGLPPSALLATVEAFNDSIDSGVEFDPFSKDGLSAKPPRQPAKSNWAISLDSPPYVCYAVTCGITFTYGGIKIDEDARVIDTTGQPFDGLYATGELTGEFFYFNYPGGTGLPRGAVFGRIAGAMAAELSKARSVAPATVIR